MEKTSWCLDIVTNKANELEEFYWCYEQWLDNIIEEWGANLECYSPHWTWHDKIFFLMSPSPLGFYIVNIFLFITLLWIDQLLFCKWDVSDFNLPILFVNCCMYLRWMVGWKHGKIYIKSFFFFKFKMIHFLTQVEESRF